MGGAESKAWCWCLTTYPRSRYGSLIILNGWQSGTLGKIWKFHQYTPEILFSKPGSCKIVDCLNRDVSLAKVTLFYGVKFFTAHCNFLYYALQDFFQKECWAHHPKPYAEFMDWRNAEDAKIEADRSKLIPGI